MFIFRMKLFDHNVILAVSPQNVCCTVTYLVLMSGRMQSRHKYVNRSGCNYCFNLGIGGTTNHRPSCLRSFWLLLNVQNRYYLSFSAIMLAFYNVRAYTVAGV